MKPQNLIKQARLFFFCNVSESDSLSILNESAAVTYGCSIMQNSTALLLNEQQYQFWTNLTNFFLAGVVLNHLSDNLMKVCCVRPVPLAFAASVSKICTFAILLTKIFAVKKLV